MIQCARLTLEINIKGIIMPEVTIEQPFYPEEVETEEHVALRVEIEALKTTFNTLFIEAQNSIPSYLFTETNDSILRRLNQKLSRLKKKINDLSIHRWSNDIPIDYLDIKSRELKSRIQTLTHYRQKIGPLMQAHSERSNLLYPNTNDIKKLEKWQNKATEILKSCSEDSLTLLKGIHFDNEDSDTPYLKSALITFSFEIIKSLEYAVSCEVQNKEDLLSLRTELSKCLETQFGATESVATKMLDWAYQVPYQAKLGSFKISNLLGAKYVKKEISPEDKIKQQIPHLYQSITNIRSFPILSMRNYSQLKIPENQLNQRIKEKYDTLSQSTAPLFKELNTLLKLFPKDSKEYKEALTLQTELQTSLNQLLFKIDKNSVTKEEGLTIWLSLSIDEQDRILKERESALMKYSQEFDDCQKNVKNGIRDLKDSYKSQKSLLAKNFMLALVKARETHQQLEEDLKLALDEEEKANMVLLITSSHQLLEDLSGFYSLLFENDYKPEPEGHKARHKLTESKQEEASPFAMLNKALMCAKNSNNKQEQVKAKTEVRDPPYISQNISSLQESTNTSIAQLNDHFKKAKKASFMLRKNRLDKSLQWLTMLDGSIKQFKCDLILVSSDPKLQDFSSVNKNQYIFNDKLWYYDCSKKTLEQVKLLPNHELQFLSDALQLRKNRPATMQDLDRITSSTGHRTSPLNPFQIAFQSESAALHTELASLTEIIANFDNPLYPFISTSSELRHWRNIFDQSHAQRTTNIHHYKATKDKAKEIERRLDTPTYKTASKVIKDIQDEYERIYMEYSKKNKTARDSLPVVIANHFKIEKLKYNQRLALNQIDPRLIKLLNFIQLLNGINSSYINAELNLSETSYNELLRNLIEQEFKDDKLEQFSAKQRYQFLHFVHFKIVKPMYIELLKFMDNINPFRDPNKNHFFQELVLPCTTELKICSLRNTTLGELTNEQSRLKRLPPGITHMVEEAEENSFNIMFKVR